MADKLTRRRLKNLEKHLKNESPILVETVKSFRQLDKVAYKTGLLSQNQSYTMQIPWWPLVSVVGTFSAGKSTFINHFLQQQIQATGTQAVDDKFTVICYSDEKEIQALPGIALDADPRFPFYQMSEELEKVSPGEGGRIDAYMRLKTCPSENLRGKMFIDSPGFDADAQRTATLRMIDNIIDISDLVLVFFDARHPEPGAMRDTLQHLVANTIHRKDSSKFLYILNQIDSTAREDNPEEVVAAWQRAIAQEGLTAGKFYCIYDPDAAIPIENKELQKRYELKRDSDLNAIYSRINQVGIDRAYRIVGALEKITREIADEKIPLLQKLINKWRKGVFLRDAVIYAVLFSILLALSIWLEYWRGLSFSPPWLGQFTSNLYMQIGVGVVSAGLVFWIHFKNRKWSAAKVLKTIHKTIDAGADLDCIIRAFNKNTHPLRSIFNTKPVGWGWRSRRILDKIVADSDRYIQKFNDIFVKPSENSPLQTAEPNVDSHMKTPVIQEVDSDKPDEFNEIKDYPA